jgi:diguanylate cyclase (GGDEF)-like protein/PAS domain S-box-containing protein
MELSNMNNMKFPAEIEETLRISAVAFETNDAIMITDADANIIRVNQSFLDTTGYSSNEVIGKNPRMMSSGKHDKSFYAGMWEQLQCTGSWSGEMFDKRKNGEIYPKWTKITAVKNELQQITHYVAVFSDLSERKRSEAEIRNLAFYDALTKLPNRHLFFDRFNAALTCAVRHNSFGAILLIDLDRFKILNDTVGHDCGDLLLIEVAARLNSCVREADTVARLGADEFVVLVEDLSDNSDEASRRIGLVAEKIRESLARPYYCNGHQLQSSPSIGVSLYHGNEESADTLVQHAEMAMYQAKSVGRNSIRFFDPVMQHRVALHAALENDLRNALSLGQLHLYYQMQATGCMGPERADARFDARRQCQRQTIRDP